jgi:hypothetical protein
MKPIIWPYKILRSIILVLLIYTLLAAAYHFILTGFADDPCFVTHENNCIRNETHSKDVLGARIQAFLTTTESGYRGGGCRNKSSSTNTLEIKTYGTNIVLERKDEIFG